MLVVVFFNPELGREMCEYHNVTTKAQSESLQQIGKLWDALPPIYISNLPAVCLKTNEIVCRYIFADKVYFEVSGYTRPLFLKTMLRLFSPKLY